MQSLESALRKLAVRLTGKPYKKVPRGLEQIICFIADNFTGASDGQEEKGEDGKGVVSVTFFKSLTGEITGGTWKDSEGEEHEITFNIKEEEV